MKIQHLAKVFIGLLWLSTLSIALCWLFWKNPPFDPEPVTVVLGLISTAVTGLLTEFDSRLHKEEFSLPYALAYGYVNNFVEPLVTQLLQNISPGMPAPRLYIFLPQNLSELEPKNLGRVIGLIRLRNFKDNVVTLEFQEGRSRDVLTITQGNDQHFYFDFPNTLLSLNSLIDYKMESRKNHFTDSIKDELARVYIVTFKGVIEKLIESKNLKPYVFFVDKDLMF
jgi:hypothetical protein